MHHVRSAHVTISVGGYRNILLLALTKQCNVLLIGFQHYDPTSSSGVDNVVVYDIKIRCIRRTKYFLKAAY